MGLATLVSLSLAWGCGDDEALGTTVATVEPVRGDVHVGESETPAPRVARVAVDESVRTGGGGLARLHLDQGSSLLLGPDANTSVDVEGLVTLGAGLAFADVLAGDQLEIATETGTLRLADAAASISVSDSGTAVYVVRGEIAFHSGDARGTVRAGEELALSAGAPAIESATLWEDWTGGLARPGPADDEAPRGVGMLEARVPDEIGRARWPLAIRRLDVRVRVEGDLAITEVDQEFFNPASETVEGLYRVRVPRTAVLQRFAVDRGGRLVDGYVREKAQARQAYEAQVYRGSTDDPALLEWDAPGAYRARIYPIAAGETRRIVIRYAEWLSRPAPGAPRIYTYPMGGGARAPHVQELAITADLSQAGVKTLRAGLGAAIEDQAVELRLSDVRPRADFWLELVDEEIPTMLTAQRATHRPPQRAPGSRIITNEADERDYWYLPVVLPDAIFEGQDADAIDLVVVADVSAATDRSHLELGRSVVESLTAHLGPDDRVAIVTSDLTIRSVEGDDAPTLGPATPDRLEALLEGLSRVSAGGATDIGAAIAASAELLDPTRNGAVIYVGDGAPTVGELGADGLLTRLGRLPTPPRLYAVGVGATANLDLLETLTRGGGLAVRVEERAGAADAALEILGHAGRPLAQRVEVDLGDGIDNVFPRRPVDVVRGEVLPVAGRVRDDPPSQIVVRGTVRGEPFEETIQVRTQESRDATDLRLRWAGERLRQQLLEGASREEVAELGTRYGLITPFTSYYVPSARELAEMGAAASVLIDKRGLVVDGITDDYGMKELPPDGRQAHLMLRGPVLLPALIAACDSMSDSEPAAASGAVGDDMNFEPPEVTDEEGMMAQEQAETEEAQIQAPQPSPTTTATPTPDPADMPTGAQGWNANQPVAPAAEPEAERTPDEAAAPVQLAETGAMGERRRAGARPRPGRYALEGPSDNEAAGREVDDLLGEALGGSGRTGTLHGGSAGGGGLAMDGRDQFAADRTTAEMDGDGSRAGDVGVLGALGNFDTNTDVGEDEDEASGSGSGYGRGAEQRARNRRVATVRQGQAEVRGSLSREIIRRVVRRHTTEIRTCYEQVLRGKPNLAGDVSTSFVITPSGGVQTPRVTRSTLGDTTVETCITQAIGRWSFPSPEGGGIVMVQYPFSFSSGGGGTSVTYRVHLHRARRCSDASGLLLDDRRAIWRERLSQAGNPAGWVRVYADAKRQCETPTLRDRRALLRIVLQQAGGVQQMIQVYRYLSDSGARGYLRAAILRRVRSPEDLRAVREAFGLTRGVDDELVKQVIERAGDGAGKIRAIRGLITQFPFSYELKLRLLEELEVQGRIPEAKRLARRLRADPMADPGVRTAIGEMYLRVGDEAEARRVFSEIVEFAPLDELARRRLGDLYRAHGWYEEAYRQYQTLAEIRPDDPGVMLFLAQAAAGAGRIDEALRLEQRVAETAEPGETFGVARAAILWSSKRFAKLREAAREAGDDERMDALLARMRRSGVLREAGDMRVTLTWSHPDAQLSLWAAHPGLGLSRPTDIAPEHGIEAFDVREREDGRYRVEVRRGPPEHGQRATPLSGEMVIVWNEGTPDEQVRVVPFTFPQSEAGSEPELARAWTIEGRSMTSAEAEGWPEVRQ